MALLTCSECQGTVSDKADFCPHCGYKGVTNIDRIQGVQSSESVVEKESGREFSDRSGLIQFSGGRLVVNEMAVVAYWGYRAWVRWTAMILLWGTILSVIVVAKVENSSDAAGTWGIFLVPLGIWISIQLLKQNVAVLTTGGKLFFKGIGTYSWLSREAQAKSSSQTIWQEDREVTLTKEKIWSINLNQTAMLNYERDAASWLAGAGGVFILLGMVLLFQLDSLRSGGYAGLGICFGLGVLLLWLSARWGVMIASVGGEDLFLELRRSSFNRMLEHFEKHVRVNR